MIIGRDKEKAILEETLHKNSSSFIAIYGRRRIGKTYLVKEFFKNNFFFSFSGIYKGTLEEQLEAFQFSIKKYGGECKKLTSYFDAFNALEELIIKGNKEKKVIFLDELSWMDVHNSKLISALEHFWNDFAYLRDDVILIVCSSASYYILNNVIHNKGGLHNRLNYSMYISPFTLKECEEYLEYKEFSYTRLMIAELYMIFGGVPYYYDKLRRDLSLVQNVDNLFFNNNAELKNEFYEMYSSLFEHPAVYIKIIEALNDKKIGMTMDEIIQKTGLSNNGKIYTYLDELISCGYIRKYNMIDKKKKDSVYELIDNFTLFHFHFLNKNYGESFWSSNIDSSKIRTWKGLSYELLCLEHTKQIKEALGISGIYTEQYSFNCKANLEDGYYGSQIDLLIKRKDQIINLIEIKYSEKNYVINKKDIDSINRKYNDLQKYTKEKYGIFKTLITTNQVEKNMYYYEFNNIVLLNDLFR